MKIEEAIEILENGGWWDLLIPITTIEGRSDEDKLHQAIDMAISALHSMPESGEPLSLEQLREMKGKPVLIRELANDKKYYAIIQLVSEVGVNLFDEEYGEDYGSLSLYGKTWLAYPYPPAHIDRSKWTAEWVNRMPILGAGDLETRCNSCGNLVLYETDFCPSCGKAMTEEAWAELERRLRG